jgi:hypothetical protein
MSAPLKDGLGRHSQLLWQKNLCIYVSAFYLAHNSIMPAVEIQQEFPARRLADAIMRQEGILFVNVAARREQQSQATLTQVRWQDLMALTVESARSCSLANVALSGAANVDDLGVDWVLGLPKHPENNLKKPCRLHYI